MRHGLTQPKARSPRRPHLNWWPLLSAEVIFGVGLTVFAFAFAWPTKSDGMRQLEFQGDQITTRWGQVQAVAMGATGLLPSRNHAVTGAALAVSQEEERRQADEAAVPPARIDVPDAPRLLLPGVQLIKPIQPNAPTERPVALGTEQEAAVPVPSQLVVGQAPIVHVAPRQVKTMPFVQVGWWVDSSPEIAANGVAVQQAASIEFANAGMQEDPTDSGTPEQNGVPAPMPKLEPPSDELLDQFALEEIASVRERLGGSVLASNRSVPDVDATHLAIRDAHRDELKRQTGTESTDPQAAFLGVLQSVLDRSSQPMPWRPVRDVPVERPDGATVMTPTIEFAQVTDTVETETVQRHSGLVEPTSVAGYHGPTLNAHTSQYPASTKSLSDNEITQHLRAWARELDAVAAEAEELEKYDRADSLRQLAQEIRLEARNLGETAEPDDVAERPSRPRPERMIVEVETVQIDATDEQAPKSSDRRTAPTPIVPPSRAATPPPRSANSDRWTVTYPRDPQLEGRAIRRLHRVREIEALQEAEAADRD